MKYSLINKYRLEKRLSKLENLVVERSVSNTGGPSKAYTIWKHLVDNGPKTVDQLKSELPKDITKYINFFADNNLLVKNGDTVSANQDYAWDDIGVIPRTAQQELMNSLRNAPMADAEVEEPRRPARAPRQRAVKQNIFSRKFDEVKAAVDAGQNVNQLNDKNQTPLLFAANSRAGNNGDIVAYLLDHGADITRQFKGANSFQLACKNHNDSAIKAMLKSSAISRIGEPFVVMVRWYDNNLPNDSEIIILAASNTSNEFDSTYHDWLHAALSRKLISRAQYEELINAAIDRLNESVYVNSRTLKFELEKDITNTIEKFADKFGFLITNERLYELNISRATAEKLLPLYKEAAAGKLRFDCSVERFTKDCNELCRITKQSNDFVANMFTPEFIRQLSNHAQFELLKSAIRDNNRDLIQKIAAVKPKFSSNEMISYINHGGVNSNNRELTRILVKMIDKSSALSSYDIYSIAGSHNEYLIAYFVDKGYGEALSAEVRRSPECDKVLRDNDIAPVNDDESRRQISNKFRDMSNREDTILSIIRSIKNDEWSSRLERAVTRDPDILLDEKIIKAVEDNDTTTARQLRRRIDTISSNKPKDTYDM